MLTPIRAIVLTYDRNRVLTDHMVACYTRLWPAHPLYFRIPYQLDAGLSDSRREYVLCSAAIKATVLRLLQDFSDEEWIYWCIDDKYPIKLNTEFLNTIVRWISESDDPNVSGILLCRARQMFNPEHLTGEEIRIGSETLLERKSYAQIWIHQFVRAGVIRHMFTQFPDNIEKARDMDKFKNELVKPSSHRLYVTQCNQSVFGESTCGGIITTNCRESILELGMAIPVCFSETASRHVIIGEM
jgi:hypothetical protein